MQQITQRCPTFKDILDATALGAKRTNDWESERSERKCLQHRGETRKMNGCYVEKKREGDKENYSK